jgi:hypothetical protein
LWNECMLGNRDALSTMFAYNKNDVKILELNYIAIRPWIHSHPNMSLYRAETSCPNCGSTNVNIEKNVYYWTSVSKFQVYRCADCGTPFHGRNNLLTKEEKKKVMTTCAR